MVPPTFTVIWLLYIDNEANYDLTGGHRIFT